MRSRKRFAWIVAASASLAGCGYTSEYVPPAAGRPRPVWQDDRIVLASRQPWWTGDATEADRVPAARDLPAPNVRVRGDIADGTAETARALSRSVPKPGGFGGGRGGGGGKDAAILLVVAALVALPVISVALATGTPEDDNEIPRVLDRYEAQGGAEPGELSLRYDAGLEVWRDGAQVSTAYRHEALERMVACVPSAREHARAARSDGATAAHLSTAGVVVGVSGAGGLAGLAFRDEPAVMAGFFATGLLLGVTGVVLAASSRGYKNSANGHAVDAVNHHNDAVAAGLAPCRGPAVRARAGREE